VGGAGGEHLGVIMIRGAARRGVRGWGSIRRRYSVVWARKIFGVSTTEALIGGGAFENRPKTPVRWRRGTFGREICGWPWVDPARDNVPGAPMLAHARLRRVRERI
jgi:hypothetical protein